jgi:hypothetical protein
MVIFCLNCFLFLNHLSFLMKEKIDDLKALFELQLKENNDDNAHNRNKTYKIYMRKS